MAKSKVISRTASIAISMKTRRVTSKKAKATSRAQRLDRMRDSTEYENGMWSGRINHWTDRGKTLKQIAKESGYKYALGYKEGRELRNRI